MNAFPNDLLKFKNSLPSNKNSITIVMGGGLAGLSASYNLVNAGHPVAVFESGPVVGGLSRTVRHGDYLFDLGGHRFYTKNVKTDRFVRDLLKGDYLTVPRKSKIFMRNKFFDYPLKPVNALLGLGMSTSVKALSDYGKERFKSLFRSPRHISLEDWVVSNFGRTMFEIYFKEYSEKVWGLDCNRISEEWVSKRIEGLSLGVAIKNAFYKFKKMRLSTLIDEFIYPPLGIGQISDNLKAVIEKNNTVMTSTTVNKIHHKDFVISNIIANNCKHQYNVKGREFVSSIPLTTLLRILDPAPPEDVLKAVSKLRYRDLVVVTIMLNRERVTDLTWMYVPEQKMPLGRIHEPKNWSPLMAPEGKTHIVGEYFCFKGDNIWTSSDEELTSITVKQLEKLEFISKHDVVDSCVIRVPGAYPVFEVGYSEHYSIVMDYLNKFKNLHTMGRTGMFRYYNMDRAIESGLEVSEEILKKKSKEQKVNIQPVGL